MNEQEQHIKELIRSIDNDMVQTIKRGQCECCWCSNQATCLGYDEGEPSSVMAGCDECCGHDCACYPIDEVKEVIDIMFADDAGVITKILDTIDTAPLLPSGEPVEFNGTLVIYDPPFSELMKPSKATQEAIDKLSTMAEKGLAIGSHFGGQCFQESPSAPSGLSDKFIEESIRQTIKDVKDDK